MTPIDPTPLKKKKKLLRDADGNVIKRVSTSGNLSVKRKLKRIKLPTIGVAPESPKPKIVIGHTPLDLVQIWEQKIPWLKNIVDIPIVEKNPSIYAIQSAGIHEDFNCIKGTVPQFTDRTTQRFKDLSQYRVISKNINNQYFFTRATAVYTEPIVAKMASDAKPINFVDLQLTKAQIPIADLRTKLFMLLAGMFEIEFGYDPEFFAFKEAQMPTKFKPEDTCGNWVRDGLAWEAHTILPSRCLNNLLTSWGSAVYGPMPTNQKNSYNPTYIPLSVAPKLEITSTMQATLTEKDLELGCNPSENLYGLTSDLALASMIPARWAGGHVHINIPAVHRNPTTVARCIRNIDAIAGVALVNMVGDWDDTQRRQFYGQAGEYRTKPYGFEYRTPSNQMWTSSYLLYAFLEIMRMAVKMALAGLDYEDIGFDTTQEEVIRTIQDNNKAMSKAILERNLPIYAAIFESKSNFALRSFGPLSAVLRVESCKELHRDTYGTSHNLRDIWGLRNQLNYLPQEWPSKYLWAQIK